MKKKKYEAPLMTVEATNFQTFLQAQSAEGSETGGGGNGDDMAKQRGIWDTDKNNLLW